jgi:hypothetical protein
MKAKPELDDPQYWRQRAQDARRLADQFGDPVAKRTLEEIAASYEQLAKLTEARRDAKS